jgi:thiol-disulfide isomerase/thioredoxin
MTRFLRALPALVLSAVALAQTPPAGRGQAPPVATPGPQAQPSRKLPVVQIRTPDTKGINLAKYRGKELVIVVFSTECEDCLKTVGFLNKIQQDFGPRGVQVVGAAANQNAPYTVGSWAQRFKVGFPVGYVDQANLIKLLALKPDDRPVVPAVLFVDSALTVRVQYFGDSPLFKDASQEKALRAIADSLLKWQAQHAEAPKPAAPKAEPKDVK